MYVACKQRPFSIYQSDLWGFRCLFVVSECRFLACISMFLRGKSLQNDTFDSMLSHHLCLKAGKHASDTYMKSWHHARQMTTSHSMLSYHLLPEDRENRPAMYILDVASFPHRRRQIFTNTHDFSSIFQPIQPASYSFPATKDRLPPSKITSLSGLQSG